MTSFLNMGLDCPERIYQASSAEEWTRCKKSRQKRSTILMSGIIVVVLLLLIFYASTQTAVIAGAVSLVIIGLMIWSYVGMDKTAALEWRRLEAELKPYLEKGTSRAEAIIAVEDKHLQRETNYASRFGNRRRWYQPRSSFNISF